jgi:predicted enzyme related to lactoylglutathione lyase
MDNPRIRYIGQIAIPVKNIDRAVAFYKDVLELPFLFQINGLAFFDVNGTRLMLSKPETKEVNHPSSVFYFMVDQIRSAFTALQAKGARMIDEPHLIAKMKDVETWMAFFYDSEDNTHALMSEVRTQ